MKKLIFLTTVLLSINAQALRDCPSDPSARWHNCFGTFNWTSGSFKGHKYTGEWQDNKKHGQGTYFYADGDKYVGEFKDDNFHGQGTYTYADGYVERGYYMNDEYVPEICEDMGLAKGTEAFGNCVVELINEVNEGG